MFYYVFLKVYKKNSKKISKSLIFAHYLFFGERCEWIAHFSQIKWAMWANRSFRSPKMSDHERFAQIAQRKWAMWANRSFRSPKMSKWVNRSFFEWIASSLIFWQKTSRSLGNQMSEFPALTVRDTILIDHKRSIYTESKANSSSFCLAGKIVCCTGNFWSECVVFCTQLLYFSLYFCWVGVGRGDFLWRFVIQV